MSGDLDLLSFDPSCDTQRAFIIKCACQVWLEFVVYFLIHLAKMDFCDVFRPQVTLTLTSWPPSWSFHAHTLAVQTVCQLASKSVHSFSKYRAHSLVTDERTDEWMHGRTDGQVENIMPPPAKLALWMYHYSWPTEKYNAYTDRSNPDHTLLTTRVSGLRSWRRSVRSLTEPVPCGAGDNISPIIVSARTTSSLLKLEMVSVDTALSDCGENVSCLYVLALSAWRVVLILDFFRSCVSVSLLFTVSHAVNIYANVTW